MDTPEERITLAKGVSDWLLAKARTIHAKKRIVLRGDHHAMDLMLIRQRLAEMVEVCELLMAELALVRDADPERAAVLATLEAQRDTIEELEEERDDLHGELQEATYYARHPLDSPVFAVKNRRN